MKECSKSMLRRVRDPNFVRRYFVGDGIDIGESLIPSRSTEICSVAWAK